MKTKEPLPPDLDVYEVMPVGSFIDEVRKHCDKTWNEVERELFDRRLYPEGHISCVSSTSLRFKQNISDSWFAAACDLFLKRINRTDIYLSETL